MDQGACCAMTLFKVTSRLTSGLVEVMFKSHISDRTDWRKMLKGEPDVVDLKSKAEELIELVDNDIAEEQRIKISDLETVSSPEIFTFKYPVEHYPEKVKAHNFDKTPEIKGILQGIKGQYLIFDNGVLNIRKYGGYEIKLET